jgi:hypothetical protein
VIATGSRPMRKESSRFENRLSRTTQQRVRRTRRQCANCRRPLRGRRVWITMQQRVRRTRRPCTNCRRPLRGRRVWITTPQRARSTRRQCANCRRPLRGRRVGSRCNNEFGELVDGMPTVAVLSEVGGLDRDATTNSENSSTACQLSPSPPGLAGLDHDAATSSEYSSTVRQPSPSPPRSAGWIVTQQRARRTRRRHANCRRPPRGRRVGS